MYEYCFSTAGLLSITYNIDTTMKHITACRLLNSENSHRLLLSDVALADYLRIKME